MSEPRSVKELDFRPKPGKKYWSSDREWREEFIYFLMVDRFHDGRTSERIKNVLRDVKISADFLKKSFHDLPN